MLSSHFICCSSYCYYAKCRHTDVIMLNVVALSPVFLIHDNKTSNSVNNCWNNIITFYSETLQGSLVKKGSCLAPALGATDIKTFIAMILVTLCCTA
jgi:hypothetical protein